jgi:hypothetical protein
VSSTRGSLAAQADMPPGIHRQQGYLRRKRLPRCKNSIHSCYTCKNA